jgi:hypothetical protein
VLLSRRRLLGVFFVFVFVVGVNHLGQGQAETES